MEINLNIFTQEETSPEVQSFFKTLIDEIKADSYYGIKLTNKPSYQTLKSSTPDFRKAVISHTLQTLKHGKQAEGGIDYTIEQIYNKILSSMMRSDQGLSEDEYLCLIEAAKLSNNWIPHWIPMLSIISSLERFIKKNTLSATAIKFLKELQEYDFHNLTSEGKIKLKLREILIKSGGTQLTYEPVILRNYHNQDRFAKAINDFTNGLEDQLKAPYYRFLALCKAFVTTDPSKKFREEIPNIAKEIGEENFKTQLKSWLSIFADDLGKKQTTTDSNGYQRTYYIFFHDESRNVAKAMVWAIKAFLDQKAMQILSLLAEKGFKKDPQKPMGSMFVAIGNACIHALAKKGLMGAAYLSRVKLKLRSKQGRALIDEYIDHASWKFKVTVAEIEDMAIPDFDLEEGKIEKQFGEYQATLKLTEKCKTQIDWKKTDGKTLKSTPASVKTDFKEELKMFKDTAKQIQAMLSTQSIRLDRSLAEGRVLSRDYFDGVYFKHSLMHHLTKQLIWSFELDGEYRDAFYWNNTWVDVHDQALENIDQAKKIKLWHPIHKSVEEVLAWRDFLNRHQICQPFKQAHREVYIVTDAEINTHEYSNRMATHILKQHQFNTLAKLRDWKYELAENPESGSDPDSVVTLQLSQNIRAEFWVQGINIGDEWKYSNICDYVSTDQVRFYQYDTQLTMNDVSPLIFSEVMRDVDLFVGVASVGNDPNWRDINQGEYRNYWESYSFGDLNEPAKTRKQALERLIPRLKIAKQCTITDKFLVVKGEIRTYKIHLGSGNILMEPNDQYLCILPDRRSETLGNKVFLPFEGDKILSIIISKAFLLAEDTKITDETILSQLKI